MSESTPHDWDQGTRLCKRCGCTSTDWQSGRAHKCEVPQAAVEKLIDATCAKCGAAFTYWGNSSAQAPPCRSCRQVTTMAADDAVAIRARMKEIEGETVGKE